MAPALPHDGETLLTQQQDMMWRVNTKKEKDTVKIKDLMDITYAH